MSDDTIDLRRTLETVRALGPLDASAMADATAHLEALTKPPGSLGRLETLVVQLAGITGAARPTFQRRVIVVAAADHGVVSQGVSAYPADVTAQMVANFLTGGAAISALARTVRASVIVVDAGVATAIPSVDRETDARLIAAPIREGTSDMSVGPAMRRGEALRAIGLGLQVVDGLVREGVDLLAVGEMGIGNTTAASAITAAMTGLPAERVTGRGTGIDDARYRHKVGVVTRALQKNRPGPADPVGVLATVGGFEVGLLVGLMLGAAASRVPVMLDGFITGAAALLAAGMAPGIEGRLIAAHRSVEPGHAVILERLGLRPLLELDLRLGEATGAALAMGLVDAAVAVRDGMATFDAAGVSGPAADPEHVEEAR
jgi:nicotinate-nucleotide--dimethylbenzimidazole phosphoribosyltransferase